MKIDGVDPLALNKIQSKVIKQEVQTLKETDTDPKIANRQRAESKGSLPKNDLSAEKLEAAVMQANDTVDTLNIGIRFKLHESSQRYMVQIIDKVENTVIKEIPSERLLNLIGQIHEMIGLLLDERQ